MASDLGTRERLLEAAIDAIETGGEAAVRVDLVAEVAAITKPSLYHFFGDREGLIVAAQAERYRRTLSFGIEAMTEATRRCASVDEFRSLFRIWVSALGAPEGRERRRVRTEVLGSSVSRPDLRELVAIEDRRVVDALAALCRIADERGWLDPAVSLEAISAWWWGMVNGRHLVDDGLLGIDQTEWDRATIAATTALLFGQPDRGGSPMPPPTPTDTVPTTRSVRADRSEAGGRRGRFSG